MNSPDTATAPSSKNRLLFPLVSVVIGLTFALVVAEWGLGYYFRLIQNQSMDPGLIQYHAQLGWNLAPNWSGRHQHYDYDVTYSTGGNSFRNQTQPNNAALVDRPSVAVLGDSFTFGLGVNDAETFVSQLNAGTETGPVFTNYAIPGTSTDQQLLLMQSLLARNAPDQVLLVVYLPNDILDNTLEYPLQAEQAKPIFKLDGSGNLELENTPVPLVAKPALMRSATMGSLVLNGFDGGGSLLDGTQVGLLVSTLLGGRAYAEAELHPVLERNLQDALTLFAALLNGFAAETSRRQTDITIALLPGRDAMVNRSGISYHYQKYLREQIVLLLADKGIAGIDLMSAMASASNAEISELYFPNDGHLTPAGHRYIAELLARQFSLY